MATLAKPSRVLGLTGCLGDLDIINTPSMINSNWLFSNMSGSGWKYGSLFIFLLLILSFLLLLIHRVTSFGAFTWWIRRIRNERIRRRKINKDPYFQPLPDMLEKNQLLLIVLGVLMMSRSPKQPVIPSTLEGFAIEESN
jgi:hypothetical protein